MIGILSVGGHVPRYRLSGKALGAFWGGAAGPASAVANYDEDSLTMSCEAALNALRGRDIKGIGACFLASTSAPYAEKSSVAILATVADLSPEVLTADLGGSLRCGTTALRLALDTVKAGRPRRRWWPRATCAPWRRARRRRPSWATGRARPWSAAEMSSRASRAPTPRARTSPMSSGFRATAT